MNHLNFCIKDFNNEDVTNVFCKFQYKEKTISLTTIGHPEVAVYDGDVQMGTFDTAQKAIEFVDKIKHLFTVYWLDGKKTVIQGTDFNNALEFSGYGKCVPLIDFYANGKDDSYDFADGKWKRKENVPNDNHIYTF